MAKRVGFTTTVNAMGTYNRLTPSPGVYTSSVLSMSASETVAGVSRRKPVGWIPPTNYSFTHNSTRAGHGLIERRMIRTSDRVTTDLARFSGPIGTNSTYGYYTKTINDILALSARRPTSVMENQALIIARNKMRSGDVNLGIAFAERNRTARLVGDTTIQLAEAILNLKRGNWKEAMRKLRLKVKPHTRRPRGRAVPQQWLALQYGWSPLLNDVYGSAAALERRGTRDWMVTGKGLKRVFTKSETDWKDLSINVRGRVEGWHGVHTRIDAIPHDDLLLSLSDLGVTNPLLVGWELVPFSFLIDWFLPIGAYLSSLDAMLGYGESWSCTSHFAKHTATFTPMPGQFDGSLDRTTIWTGSASDRVQKDVYLERKAMNGVPLPSIPSLKDPRSLGHMANGLSLLATVVGGHTLTSDNRRRFRGW